MTRLTSLADLVRIEDLALAGWVVIGLPVLALVAGPVDDPFFPSSPLVGLLYLAGFAGAIVCVVSRPLEPIAGSDSGELAAGRLGVPGALGPFVGGLMLIGGGAMAAIGGSTETGFAIALFAGLFGFMLPGPRLSPAVRRALVVPYTFAASTAFDAWIAQLGGAFGVVGPLGAGFTADVRTILASLGLTTLFTIVFYAMLVFAPRQIAEREGSALAWVVRYLLFVVALTFGAGWLRTFTG